MVKEAFDLAEDEVEEKTILLDIVDEAFVEELKETYEGDAEDPILKDTELFKKDNGEDDAEKKADYEKKCLKSVMKSSRFKMPPVCREMFDKKLEKGFAENELIIHGQDGGKLVGDGKFTDEARWKKKKKTVELEVNKVLKEVADSCKIEGGDQAEEDTICGKMLPTCACLIKKAGKEGLGVDGKGCQVFKAKECDGKVKVSDDTCIFNVASMDSTKLIKVMDGAVKDMEDAAKKAANEDLEFTFDENASDIKKDAVTVEVKFPARGPTSKVECVETSDPEMDKIIEAVKVAILDQTLLENARRRLNEDDTIGDDESVAVTVRSSEDIAKPCCPKNGRRHLLFTTKEMTCDPDPDCV